MRENISTKKLATGDIVIFKKPESSWPAWYEGRIINANGGRYKIQEHIKMCAPELQSCAPHGETFSNIKPKDVAPKPEEIDYVTKMWMCSIPRVEFRDPLKHLYAGGEAGSIELPTSFLSSHGINTQTALETFAFITNRRHYSKLANGITPRSMERLLRSILPTEIDTHELKRKAQTNSKLMLQLADATYFGLMGIMQDDELAMKYYLCAACGCSKAELDRMTRMTVKFAYLRGEPEAMNAYGSCLLEKYEGIFGGMSGLIDAAKQGDADASGAINHAIFYFSQACRHDLVCQAMLRFTQCLRTAEWINIYINPNSAFLLQDLDIRAEAWKAEQQHAMSMGPQAGEPSEETLDLFRPRATEIFLSLPVRKHTGTGVSSQWHISFHQHNFPPYPIVCMMINPPSEYCKPLIIEKSQESTPYSNESFESIWVRMCFQFHRGDSKGGDRSRPALITMFDRPGDRQLAAFIKEKIGKKCKTKISIVGPDERYRNISGSTGLIKDTVDRIVSKLAEGTAKMMNCDEDKIRTTDEQAMTAFSQRTDISLEQLHEKLQRLKEEGNAYFGQGRFRAAVRCYSEAIDVVEVSANIDNSIHTLLGTLLSNRSQCFLNLSESMSPASAIGTLRNALKDCEKALDSSWKNSILPQVQRKLQARKEEARTKLNILVNRVPTQPEEAEASMKAAISVHNGSGIIESGVALNAQADDDVCPSCHAPFKSELARCPVVVVSCKHACCLPCLYSYYEYVQKHKSEENQGQELADFACPVCRMTIDQSVFNTIEDLLLAQKESLKSRVNELPLSRVENKDIYHRLLVHHKYEIEKVISALDAILIDNLYTLLSRTKELTSEEKQEIYETARKPVDDLTAKLQDLKFQLEAIRDRESQEHMDLAISITKMESEGLPAARRKARDEIWSKMNEAGDMGKEREGQIEFDFHGMKVKEARERFENFVLPVLPAQEGVVKLIVGRGKHSSSGVSILKPAMTKHIAQHHLSSQMDCQPDPDNPGVLVIRWTT